jgi:hypothetical protein
VLHLDARQEGRRALMSMMARAEQSVEHPPSSAVSEPPLFAICLLIMLMISRFI